MLGLGNGLATVAPEMQGVIQPAATLYPYIDPYSDPRPDSLPTAPTSQSPKPQREGGVSTAASSCSRGAAVVVCPRPPDTAAATRQDRLALPCLAARHVSPFAAAHVPDATLVQTRTISTDNLDGQSRQTTGMKYRVGLLSGRVRRVV